MRFHCRKSWWDRATEYARKHRKWERIFAWRPRRLNNGECAWLEYIERRVKADEQVVIDWDDWEYRELKSGTEWEY